MALSPVELEALVTAATKPGMLGSERAEARRQLKAAFTALLAEVDRLTTANTAQTEAVDALTAWCYQMAATVDGEWGCAHDAEAIRTKRDENGSVIPDDCAGAATEDKFLPLLDLLAAVPASPQTEAVEQR